MSLITRIRNLEALIGATTGLSAAELDFNDGAIAGTVVANKTAVAGTGKDIGIFGNHSSVNVIAGAAGTAGAVRIFPTTTAKGHVDYTIADQTGNGTVVSTIADQTAARTFTLPVTSANCSYVMGAVANQTVTGNVTVTAALDSATLKNDAVTLSPLKWVDVDVTAAVLDGAGNVTVIAGVAGDQYKIRDIRLTGGGTSFAAGGNRLIDLTDGTTVWTTIANADIESAPAATLAWGNAKVPFLTGVSNTKSASNAAIRFQYSGGTTDHSATGNISFSVCLEKTN